ncbi:GNAT family N-acetyltransferase [Flavivirga sp. 57AJ16]|uniref:GNAT family N-acetyltransferase n=1 Tax=Flavivirga sp. 57AJ16 TaxID=3025307 RepID=UPI002365A443|nr:GNAT family N-acetyltransferase [Flavivirga sp. 57AJ16]MDD7887452.1 GNAT family N-acetyltransferase [Flavivirga sp. 57AJ16]
MNSTKTCIINCKYKLTYENPRGFLFGFYLLNWAIKPRNKPYTRWQQAEKIEMQLQKAIIKDITELRKICIDAYSKNFYDHWNEGGLEWYLEKEFSAERLKFDLLDKDTEYYFIKRGLKNVGFIKIKNNTNKDLNIENAVELEKIYVLPECKGMGIGKSALTEIIKKTKEHGYKNLILCVIDTNVNAIAFYEKLGFIFHSKTILDIPYFKEELKGMNRMIIQLDEKSQLPTMYNR